MRIFDIDGPVVQFLGKLADLMWLNILTMICCIPVITIGAALTSLHYMSLKIVRKEEGYITKGYFKAFKENFKQSTIIWLIFMVIFGVLFVDYRLVIRSGVEINNVLKVLILIVAVAVLFTFMFVFPMQSKFYNTIKLTIRNSFMVSVLQFPKTVCMIVLYVIPYVLLYKWASIFPVFFVFFLSGPAFVSAWLYNGAFKKMEEQILAAHAAEAGEGGEQAGIEGESAAPEEDERIFRDELDETIELGQNNQ